MTKAAFREFATAIEDFSRDIVRACRRGARTIAAMPWPAMLACCIVLAAAVTLIVSILPLALFLFIVFMAVKLVAGACGGGARRTRPTHYKHEH